MLIGYITKEMTHDKTKRTLRSPANLQEYTIPLEFVGSWDIGRKVYLDDNGEVQIESIKAANARRHELFKIEKAENRPIVNINTSGDYVEPSGLLSEDEATNVNKHVID